MEMVKSRGIQTFGKIIEDFTKNTFNEDEQREINKYKISDLLYLVKPYLKNSYETLDYLLEDVMVGILENDKTAVDIIERPF